MDCEAARDAISAILDDEDPGIERQELEAHLDRCAACRRWRDNAHAVTRNVRLAPARPVPPPPLSLLAAASARSGPTRQRREIALTRVALVAIAATQLIWVSIPALMFGADSDAPIHISHEMGSFDLAVAVGFLVAGWQPARAQGMRALLGVAALLLALTAGLDLAHGSTSVSDELPHMLVVVGWLLVRRLATLTPSSDDGRGFGLPAFLRIRMSRRTPAALQHGAAEHDLLSGRERSGEDLAA